MKIKIFVACEIQYFEIGMSSFNSYVYYLTRGFIAPTRAFNLLTRDFNLPTCAFSVLIDGFELATLVLLFHDDIQFKLVPSTNLSKRK